MVNEENPECVGFEPTELSFSQLATRRIKPLYQHSLGWPMGIEPIHAGSQPAALPLR